MPCVNLFDEDESDEPDAEAFSDLEYAVKRKVTQREWLLGELKAFASWRRRWF